MPELTRITPDPRVLGGRPCVRGMRLTVGYGRRLGFAILQQWSLEGRSLEPPVPGKSQDYDTTEDLVEQCFVRWRRLFRSNSSLQFEALIIQ